MKNVLLTVFNVIYNIFKGAAILLGSYWTLYGIGYVVMTPLRPYPNHCLDCLYVPMAGLLTIFAGFVLYAIGSGTMNEKE